MASSQLVALNGSSNIARSVLSSLLARNPHFQALRLIDAKPYRKSVYRWQSTLGGVHLEKHLARSAQSIDLGLEGA